MEVEYSLEIDDALAFVQYNWKYGPKELRLKRFGWIGAFLLGGMLYLAGLDITLNGNLSGLTILLLFLLGGTLLIQMLIPWFADRKVRRLFKRSEGKAEFQWRRLTLSSEGLHSVSEHADGIMKWPAIEKIVVTDEHLFLYTSPTAAIIVPKRAFEEEWQFTDFVDHARRYHEAHRPPG
jgi:hypothetical protein